jgi:hypothetical protein
VERISCRQCITPVRAFYLDLSQWAVEDPARWQWAAPCPVGQEEISHLVLVDPSLRVVGIQSDLGVDEVLARRGARALVRRRGRRPARRGRRPHGLRNPESQRLRTRCGTTRRTRGHPNPA